MEGVAAGRADHDDPYSLRRIPDRFFDPATGLSVDGTAEYLDRLVADGARGSSADQEARIHVHRRCESRPTLKGADAAAESHGSGATTANSTGLPVEDAAERRRWDRGDGREAGQGRGGGDADDGGGDARSSCLWRDKIQMINTVAFSLERECLMVQIDADELWTAEQLVRLRDMFLDERNANNVGSANVDGAGGKDKDNAHREPHAVAAETDEDSNLRQGRVGDDEKSRLEGNSAQRHSQHHGQQQELHHDDQTPRNKQCAYFHCHRPRDGHGGRLGPLCFE